MKTIAVALDEDTLAAVDSLLQSKSQQARSRSELVRKALQTFIEKEVQKRREQRESKIFYKHRKLLRKQVHAMLREQAKP